MYALRITVACLAATLATLALAEPGTPAWVKADAVMGSPSALPAIALTFKGYREKTRFFVAITRNGEPYQLTRGQAGYSQQCSNDFPLAYHEKYVCVMPADPTKSPAENVNSKPGTMGYAMFFRNLEWNSEFCFRLKAQDDKGEYAKLWTGWACARTNAAPPPLGAPYGVELVGLPATAGDPELRNGTPDRLHVSFVLQTGWVESWIEKSPDFNNASWTRIPNSRPAAGGLVIDYALDQKPAYFRVCASNVVQRACSSPKRFPPRGLEENAKADSAPRYEQQRPPVTNANARAGSTVTAAPPPVTATNAMSTKPAAPPITSNAITRPGSSFDRGSGGLR